jgi:7-cyano-7-deazaguanine synthase
MKNAIVLCSGGLDSVVTANYAKKRLNYNKIIILFFNYGQKTLIQERKCSKVCAKIINAEFKEIKIDWINSISGSFINKKGKIRRITKEDLKDTEEESKKFYVPHRNTLFITFALALAESIFVKSKKEYDILLGFKCEGKESYPDTTINFIKKFNNLSKTASSGNFKIIAPLIKMDKEDIILLGKKLNVDFKKTFSCYIGKNKHCGYCLACKLRQAGFYWANEKDPTLYIN